MKDNHIKLQEYINNIASNEKESGSLFSTSTDLQHLIYSGINTIEEYEHSNAVTEHYELYREMYGIKPRWILYDDMTTEEIVKDIKKMMNEYDLIELREKEEADELSRIIQKRKAKNAYKPNNVFSDLKSLIAAH